MIGGVIYARLIRKYIVEGANTKYHSIADVKPKYQNAARQAYLELFGVDAPEE